MSNSPNLIQKLLFRQFSPKTRPCSMAMAVRLRSSIRDDTPFFVHLVRRKCQRLAERQRENEVSGVESRRERTTSVFFFSYATNGRRITAPTTPKTSWSNSSSSSNCKQIAETNESAFLAPPSNFCSSKNQSSELASYLSRRRNTTGSISLNKIVDLKNTSSGNPLKFAAGAASASHNSNQKLSSESKSSERRFLRPFVFVLSARCFSSGGRIRFIHHQTNSSSK